MIGEESFRENFDGRRFSFFFLIVRQLSIRQHLSRRVFEGERKPTSRVIFVQIFDFETTLLI